MRSTLLRGLTAIALFVGVASCDPAPNPIEPTVSASYNPLDLLTIATGSDTTVVQVIDTAGGLIKAGRHELSVPQGAVGQATEFTFTVVRDGYIRVDLSARRVSDGEVVDTFSPSLELRLSYRDASVGDPLSLTNVYLVDGTPNGTLEVIPSTVHIGSKRVTSPLSHFSGYAVGTN